MTSSLPDFYFSVDPVFAV